MKKYRFVGDIHGQYDVMQKALDCDADRIIFCGDLVDSYTRSIEDQIKCVELALETAGNGVVDVVWANHEWSYFHPKMRCSGYKERMSEYIDTTQEEMLSKFKPFIFEQDTLVTHAGLTLQMWDTFNLTKDTFQQTLTKWSGDMGSPFFFIGRSRGGPAQWGGPLWCDFNSEFIPIPELNQVFGHTRGKGLRKKENAWCIDTLENTAPKFLDLEFE